MKIKYQCSNCGKWFQTSTMAGVPHGMYWSGVRVNGDAVYCEDCVNTWADRNGKPFDEQYKEPWKMFCDWWNKEVNRQAKIEGKKVKTYSWSSSGFEQR